ncbi:MAG: hypothetical protein Q9211_000338 [Gyalolechia sp. 1 TL-2023]
MDEDKIQNVGCKELAITQDAPSQDYIECECGEAVLLAEFNDHAQLHTAESADMALDSARLPEGVTLSPPNQHMTWPATTSPLHLVDLNTLPAANKAAKSPRHGHEARSSKLKHVSRSNINKQHPTLKEWIDILLGSTASTARTKSHSTHHKDVRRLGKAELGPYAHEEQMPAWLYRQLERGAKVSIVNQIGQGGGLVRLEVVANEARSLLPVLAQLCEQDSTLSKVFLCHPGVQHVFKMAKEGGFCGYRNIQMMVGKPIPLLYIQELPTVDYLSSPTSKPPTRKVMNISLAEYHQFLICKNSSKALGTGVSMQQARSRQGVSEELGNTLARQSCEASAFNDLNNPPAFEKVYRDVERYFMKRTPLSSEKVSRTSLPPIYFQHQGHSLTIVGLEIRKSGSRNLLVFDPSFKPSPGIERLVGSTFRAAAPEKLLKAYRRGDSYLSKHSSFEILK